MAASNLTKKNYTLNIRAPKISTIADIFTYRIQLKVYWDKHILIFLSNFNCNELLLTTINMR